MQEVQDTKEKSFGVFAASSLTSPLWAVTVSATVQYFEKKVVFFAAGMQVFKGINKEGMQKLSTFLCIDVDLVVQKRLKRFQKIS